MDATERIVIRVPALPVSQPRQRHKVDETASGRRYVKNYTPSKDPVNTFKAMVRFSAVRVFRGAPLSGPLRVDAVFVFPRTKAQSKLKAQPRLRHSKKPDRDNLDKAVLDALSGLIWRDDAQVCDGRIQKWIASGDEKPHCVITVSPALPVA